MPRRVYTPPPGYIHYRDIMLTHDVRRVCGGIARSTLIAWRRDRGFPEPVRSIRAGRGVKTQFVDIYDRRQVRAWLKANPPVSNLIEPE